MVYKLAHILQKRLKPLWALVEAANAALFRLRYGARCKKLPAVTAQYPGVSRVTEQDADALERFFASQPKYAFEYFTPHNFDAASLARLAKSPARLMYVIREKGEIVGYFFLRCFFIGKSYLGKMVDDHRQNEGICQQMCCCAMDIATALGLRMFESISRQNLASLGATQKVLETRIIEELDNDVLYIEDIRRKQVCG